MPSSDFVTVTHAGVDGFALVPRRALRYMPGWTPVTDAAPDATEENEPAEQTAPAAAAPAAFDPSEHTVTEVTAYLAGVDDAERDRVLAAERAGQARKSLIG